MFKRKSPDLSDDGSMPFTEHIEELRTHLLRALYGLFVAVLVMLGYANQVVKLLTDPLNNELERWHRSHTKTVTEKFTLDQSQLPAERRARLTLDATIPKEQWTNRFAGNAAAATVAEQLAAAPIQIHVDAASLIRDLNRILMEVNQPWRPKTLSAQEPFLIYFKAVVGSALVLASPWVFYQLYAFVAVGLYAHERRFVHMTLPFSVVLFLSGVAFCYFVMFKVMLAFLLSANNWMDVQPDIRLSEWVGFAVLLMLIFGVTFQLPLLMLMLERVGIVTYQMLAEKRKLALFGIFVFAAVVTPTPDPFAQTLLAVPVYGLFELGLLLMKYFQRRNPFAVGDPSDELADDLFAPHATR
jgi:sec-independent protein translocase protein TatC